MRNNQSPIETSTQNQAYNSYEQYKSANGTNTNITDVPTFTNADLNSNSSYNTQELPSTNNNNYRNNISIQPFDFNSVTHERFRRWLDDDYNGTKKADVDDYYQYLQRNAGYAPPMEQMLRSARSWRKCGFEPYGVPPREYWDTMVETVRLLKTLIDNHYLPENYELVSVYRNKSLNRCAKGSKGSKHIINAAMDIKIPYTNKGDRVATEEGMCQFWYNQGDSFRMGLGLYKSGAIHIDTQGHRTWGSTYRSSSSRCLKDKYKFVN